MEEVSQQNTTQTSQTHVFDSPDKRLIENQIEEEKATDPNTFLVELSRHMTEKVGHESTYIEVLEETRSKTNVVSPPTVSF